MTNQPPGPETIDKLTLAAYPPFAMLAGIQLDVFTPLSEGAKPIEQLAEGWKALPIKLKPLSTLWCRLDFWRSKTNGS